MDRIDDLAKVFRALGDPNRLAILQLIRRRCPDGCRLSEADEGSSVSRIAERFDLSLSTVSHHLKELRNAGLIVCEKRGQWVYCGANPDVLETIREFIDL